jgi:SAM-dependent methyltransferase
MTAPCARRTVSFDRVADRCDVSRGGHARAETTAAAIAPWPTANGPVIEVGVGTGLIASKLAARECSVVGLDVSLRMREQAQRRLGPRIPVGDAHRLPVRAAVANAVIFAHVLHLLADVPATFAEAARVLRPGGRVVVIYAADERVPTLTPAEPAPGRGRQQREMSQGSGRLPGDNNPRGRVTQCRCPRSRPRSGPPPWKRQPRPAPSSGPVRRPEPDRRLARPARVTRRGPARGAAAGLAARHRQGPSGGAARHRRHPGHPAGPVPGLPPAAGPRRRAAPLTALGTVSRLPAERMVDGQR